MRPGDEKSGGRWRDTPSATRQRHAGASGLELANVHWGEVVDISSSCEKQKSCIVGRGMAGGSPPHRGTAQHGRQVRCFMKRWPTACTAPEKLVASCGESSEQQARSTGTKFALRQRHCSRAFQHSREGRRAPQAWRRPLGPWQDHLPPRRHRLPLPAHPPQPHLRGRRRWVPTQRSFSGPTAWIFSTGWWPCCPAPTR